VGNPLHLSARVARLSRVHPFVSIRAPNAGEVVEHGSALSDRPAGAVRSVQNSPGVVDEGRDDFWWSEQF